jgi:hypothetical protein
MAVRPPDVLALQLFTRRSFFIASDGLAAALAFGVGSAATVGPAIAHALAVLTVVRLRGSPFHGEPRQ